MAEYDTITVSAGDTFRYNLGSGETWENKLIDISASGASFKVHAREGNWTVRNIGIRGQLDQNKSYGFNLETESGNTGRIENVYIPGVSVSLSPNSKPTGMYCYWTHAGTIKIDRCNIQNVPDNGIYGSAPGNPDSDDQNEPQSSYGYGHPNPGSLGEVHVTNTYAGGNDTANIRLGTDGSYAKNCVMWGGDHRGYWGYYRETELINCDIGNNGSYAVQSGSGWHVPTTVTLTNTRVSGGTGTAKYGSISGSSAGQPRRSSPDEVEGVPLSPEEAASGSGSGQNNVALGATTGSVKNVTDTAATLTGTLDGLGGSPNADVYFEYRKIGHPGTSGGSDGGSSPSPSPQDYDTITVGAGETFTKQMSDGETWQNKLIDITADGASYDFLAVGNDWTIRNIGVKGKYDSSNYAEFTLYVPDPDSTCVIENVYLPGQPQKNHDYSGSAGIYVHPKHAGDLLIKNANIQYHPDNGIYASSPGNSSAHPTKGQGGTIRIEDSYFEGNATDHTRLGTDGSYVKNCCGWNGMHRGHWQYYEHSKLIDCDYGNNPSDDIVVGQTSWKKSASVTVENTRYGTSRRDDGTLSGSSAGSPQKRVPDGCPTSAKDAAQGL